ncbi:hypothetical protein LEMLEM_LOCUS6661, partial [Lemmus lemmus]
MFGWGYNICCVATESNSETHPGWQEEKPDLKRATTLMVLANWPEMSRNSSIHIPGAGEMAQQQ